MKKQYDLIGIGIGPFNLSLAALLEKAPTVQNLFLEKKSAFDWHPELMFSDSTMQTTYLSDLVTPVDPTSPYSFLNYLCEQGRFYQFLNTERKMITRKEFEQYCSWVSQKLEYKLKFNTDVQDVTFKNNMFCINTTDEKFESKNICIATGLVPKIPACAKPFIGPKIFHAKSHYLKSMNLHGKSVVIVGGGQTGIEIFRNAIFGKWGNAHSIRLITSTTLEAFEESPFTSDYFTPTYVDSFWNLNIEKKDHIVSSQKLLSDGNTPSYLSNLYNDLYRLKYVEGDERDIRIFGCRRFVNLSECADGFQLQLQNTFYDCHEEMSADIVILSTGFEHAIPKILAPLFDRIKFDSKHRFQFKKSYAIEWDGPEENQIYALNFSRHNHGIVDPQTSLMAWRSAVVVNNLTNTSVYKTESKIQNFVEYNKIISNTNFTNQIGSSKYDHRKKVSDLLYS